MNKLTELKNSFAMLEQSTQEYCLRSIDAYCECNNTSEVDFEKLVNWMFKVGPEFISNYKLTNQSKQVLQSHINQVKH